MIITLMPKMILSIGVSPFVAGLIGSLYGAVQVFSSPLMGRLGDTQGRKTLLLISYIGPALGYFALGVSPSSILVIILSRIHNGITKHGLSTSKAYLADITPSKDRASILGTFNAISGLGFIIGPLMGGQMADADPTFQLNMFCGAFIYMLNVFLILIFVPPLKAPDSPTVKPDPKGRSSKPMCSPLAVFTSRTDSWMRNLIVLRFFLTFATLLFRENFTIFLEQRFSISYTAMGRILSFNGIVTTVAAATCGHVSWLYSSIAKHVLHATVLLAFSILMATLAPNPVLMTVCLIPMGVATAHLRICVLSLMLMKGQEDQRGMIIGMGDSVASISRMVGPSVVGLLQEWGVYASGYAGSMLAGAAAMVIAVMFRDSL